MHGIPLDWVVRFMKKLKTQLGLKILSQDTFQSWGANFCPKLKVIYPKYSKQWPYTVAKNWGAYVAMDFTKSEYLAPLTIEKKNPILGAVLELLPAKAN